MGSFYLTKSKARKFVKNSKQTVTQERQKSGRKVFKIKVRRKKKKK